MANCKGFKITFAPWACCKAIAAGIILVSLVSGESAFAQERSQCFMVGENGELIDLTSVCSPPSGISSNKKTEPTPEKNPTPEQTSAPEKNPTPEQTPTSEGTQEPPTNPTSSSDNGKKPTNSNLRSADNSSGLTQPDNTEATRRVSRQRQRKLERRGSISR